MVWKGLKKLAGKTLGRAAQEPREQTDPTVLMCTFCNKRLAPGAGYVNLEGSNLVACQDCGPKLLIPDILSKAIKERRNLTIQELREAYCLCKIKGFEGLGVQKPREANPGANEVVLDSFQINNSGKLELGFRCLKCRQEIVVWSDPPPLHPAICRGRRQSCKYTSISCEMASNSNGESAARKISW